MLLISGGSVWVNHGLVRALLLKATLKISPTEGAFKSKTNLPCGGAFLPATWASTEILQYLWLSEQQGLREMEDSPVGLIFDIFWLQPVLVSPKHALILLDFFLQQLSGLPKIPTNLPFFWHRCSKKTTPVEETNRLIAINKCKTRSKSFNYWLSKGKAFLIFPKQ